MAEPTDHPNRPAIVCRDEESCDDLDLKLSRAWLRIAIAGVFAGQGMMFSLALNMTPPPYGSLPYMILHGGLIFSSVIVMAFLGGPLFASTWGMLRGRRLSIEGLFTVSLLGAFVGSVVGSVTGEGDVFYEVVAIVIAIYTFGRMLGERSQQKLRLESARLRERYDLAVVIEGEGLFNERPVTQVEVGAIARVDPGAAFTVDGVIRRGVGYVQETALTGEPLPVVKRVGDTVRAGTWSLDSQFEVEVIRAGGDRELDTILDTVDAADGRPSELQTQANELVQLFLPLVVGVSAVTAISWAIIGTWIDAVLNSMAVLLVACPCALGLATPVAISNGLFQLARLGLISRDGKLIDVLAQTRKIFFDKTGTLSESSLRVSECWFAESLPIARQQIEEWVQQAESSVNHPVARAIVDYLNPGNESTAVSFASLRTVAGQGVECSVSVEGGEYLLKIGEAELCENEEGISKAINELHDSSGKKVFVSLNQQIVACFVLKEQLRSGVAQLWPDLDKLKVSAHVLTGDPSPQVTIPDSILIESALSSEEKEERVKDSAGRGEQPVFVGDGINDVVSMTSATGSISLHSGTALARSVATGQLNADDLMAIPRAIHVARMIHQRLRGNLIYALIYNLFGMGLAAAGVLHPIFAALIMLISSFWVTARVLSLQNVKTINFES